MHPLTEGYTFPKGMKHNLNKKSKMEDNLSELGKPSSKAKYESLSDSEQYREGNVEKQVDNW